MNEMYAVAELDDEDQMTLSITLPKSLETFDVDGKGFLTEKDLKPMMRVKFSGEGYIGKAQLNFGEQKTKWKVLVDDVELEIL